MNLQDRIEQLENRIGITTADQQQYDEAAKLLGEKLFLGRDIDPDRISAAAKLLNSRQSTQDGKKPVDWRKNLPAGGTLAGAEQAKILLARFLAENDNDND